MHRVYVHDGSIWILASRYAELGPLPAEAERYTVLETQRPPSVQTVCLLTDDGRRLCDIGPEHVHDEAALLTDEQDDLQNMTQRRSIRGD